MDWLKDDDETIEELGNPWNVLIVDDDEQIHQVTRLALKNFVFDDRPLNFISVYSGKETIELLNKNEEKYALILLDVIMEESDTGLKIANYIRNDLRNHYSRIILRTGQAGLAPEFSIVKNYDIDAYKSKTELKRSDLEAVFYTTLRSYRDILTIKNQREGLQQVVSSITKINSSKDLPDFASAILNQIQLLVGCDEGELLLEQSDSYAISRNGKQTKVLAVSKSKDTSVINNNLQKIIDNSFKLHTNYYNHPYFVHFLETHRKNEIVLSLRSKKEISPQDKELLNLFSSNIALTYENLLLNEDVNTSQKVLVSLLSAAMESSSKETGSHVKRIGELSASFGTFLDLDTDFIENLRISAQLHDVGKVGTPDAILNKPGKLEPDEWEIMKQHALNGYKILNSTNIPIIMMGANIALEHHEWWNGSGYPKGIKGNEISLEGRIVAITDVFDALLSKRCYKEPWSIEEVAEHLENSKGSQFDPTLIDTFLKNIDFFYSTYKEIEE